MVDRIQGGIREGLWFSADVVFATLTTTNGGVGFDVDLAAAGTLAGVNSELEQVIEAIQTRGNVIGLTVTGAAILDLCIDYGQNFGGPLAGQVIGNQTVIDVQTEVEALVNGVANQTGAAFTLVGPAFASA